MTAGCLVFLAGCAFGSGACRTVSRRFVVTLVSLVVAKQTGAEKDSRSVTCSQKSLREGVLSAGIAPIKKWLNMFSVSSACVPFRQLAVVWCTRPSCISNELHSPTFLNFRMYFLFVTFFLVTGCVRRQVGSFT